MKLIRTSILILLMVILGGCSQERKQARGFRLPDGDIESGKKAFVALNCNTCHTVPGVKIAAPEGNKPYEIPLGGEVYKVKTYGQLVTAIIHPSHDISLAQTKNNLNIEGESPMPSFTEQMTVKQMIDLVTFLHSQYRLRASYYYNYDHYPRFY